jgi:hypothetical protein
MYDIRLVLDFFIRKLSIYRSFDLTRLLKELETTAVNDIPT